MHALQGVSKRTVAAFVAAGSIGVTTVILAWPSPAGADVISSSDSAALPKMPASETLQLEQFDPQLGTLTTVTVTATLAGEAQGQVWNLGSASEEATLSFEAGSNLEGPLAAPLDVEISDSVTLTLAGKETTSFALSASDSSVTTSTDAADLALFTGTGQVEYLLTGSVTVEVSGKANWHHKGGSSAVATVKVEYEYTPVGTTTTTTTLPPTTTTTTTLPPTTTTLPTTTTTLPTTTTTTTTTTSPPTTTTLPPTTTTSPPTTTTLPPTTTTLPYEPEGCPPSYWGQSGVGGQWTGYNGADSFNAVFGLTDPPHPDLSLKDALNAGGLRSNAVAALLNASHPDIDGFPYSAGEVIALTASALDSGTGIDALAAQFAAANDAVCPL